MITIRVSEDSDRKQQTALWLSCFGDTKQGVDAFYGNCGKTARSLVALDGETLVSMLYLLPAALKIGGRTFSAEYVFAACTAPDYRGQGIMARLLEKAARSAEENGTDYLFLVPAEPSLYDYYRKFGYQTAFYKKALCFNREEAEERAKEAAFVTDCTPHALLTARDKALQNESFVRWNTDVLGYFLDAHRLYGGKLIRGEHFFAAFSSENGEAEAFECLGDWKNALYGILENCSAERFTICLPPTADIGRAEPAGMLKPVCAEKTADGLYIGITLE